MNINDLSGLGSNQNDWLEQQKALAADRARSEAAAAQQEANLRRLAAERADAEAAAARAAADQVRARQAAAGAMPSMNVDNIPEYEKTPVPKSNIDDLALKNGMYVNDEGNLMDIEDTADPFGGNGSGKATTGAYEQMQKKVLALEKTIGVLLRQNGGGYAKTQRLFINVETEQAKTEAALRIGLNEGELNIDDVKNQSTGVISWISNYTGIPQERVSTYLNQTLAAGASALTMILAPGNFPLAASAYFATQALLPRIGKDATAPDGTKKVSFNGYSAEGSIDGKPLTALGVTLPMGLPNEIFGDYRFTCYDKLTNKWYPSDEIEPIQYWGGEDYRYVCLDRVSSKIYHANKIKAVRLYV